MAAFDKFVCALILLLLLFLYYFAFQHKPCDWIFESAEPSRYVCISTFNN